jgi:hypothetical protein
VVKDLHDLGPQQCEQFHRSVVTPNSAPERKRGQYAVAVRKRRPEQVEG